MTGSPTGSLYVVETDTERHLGRLNISANGDRVQVLTGMPGRPAVLLRSDVVSITLAYLHPDYQET